MLYFSAVGTHIDALDAVPDFGQRPVRIAPIATAPVDGGIMPRADPGHCQNPPLHPGLVSG